MLRSASTGITWRMVATLALTYVVFLVSCAPAAPPPAEAPQAAPGGAVEVVHATWAEHADLLAEAFKKFEQESGIKIKLAPGTTGDRQTKLFAERGNPSIDIAIVSPKDGLRLLDAGVVEPPNMNLPNVKNLHPAARHPAGYVASLLAVGLAYNPEKSKPSSWLDLWDPKYKGKVGMLAWPGGIAAVQLVVAARLHGGSDDNLAPGFEAVKKLLPVRFVSSEPALEPFYAQGDIWINAGISGATLAMKKKGVPIDWVAPREGAVVDYNVLVIPKGVKNRAAAEKFVDFFLGPDVQLAYARGRFYGPVNQTVQVPPDLAPIIHPTAEEAKNVQTIPWEKLAQMDKELTDRWNREIAGK